MMLVQEFLSRIAKRQARIAVLGDAMVDEYYQVTSTGISPEFPIPVMKSFDAYPDAVPGGAANVARQFEHLNTQATLFCFLDEYTRKVCANLTTSYVDLPMDCACPIKRRLYDGLRPTYRWDIEQRFCGMDDLNHAPTWEMLRMRCEAPAGFIDNKCFDAVIYSDYDKGVFHRSNWTAKADWYSPKRVKVPVIVDPKTPDIEKWDGCAIFKPNAIEATKLSGIPWNHRRDQCQYFMDAIDTKAVVITHGGQGVCGMNGNEYFEYFPDNRLVEAISVIGAGDCFVSFLALATAHGFSVQESAKIAFDAGAVYVQRHRNQPVKPRELLSWVDRPTGKIYDNPADLFEKGRDHKLVMANGCFDILHAGHLELLRFAKSKGNKLVVATNTDASIKRLKGEERPFQPLDNRMEMLANLEMVDYVVSFDEDDPTNIIKKVGPDVLVKGDEYQPEQIVGRDLVKEVYRCPMVRGLSTTAIMKKARPVTPDLAL